MRAVIDRIVDGKHAVLLVEDQEQKVIPREHLPEDAQAGDWLEVTFDGDRLLSARVDEQETEAAIARISDKIRRLMKRGRTTRPSQEG